MADKELLELAAKAAEMRLWRDRETDSDYWGDATSNYICSQWNPLTNDGDALRLAVRLGLRLWFREDNGFPVVNKAKGAWEAREELDPYAATRRAIVRAAAEIGRD